MTELLVGTRKGLFVLEGEPGSPFDVTDRAFAGEPVEYAMRDPRSGRVLASVTSPFYGPKLWYRDDPGGRVGAGGRRRGARARRARARADLGDRDRRGGGHAVRRRRPRRAVREPRRRRHVRAQPRALGASLPGALAAGSRRAVPALDRDLAGRAGAARGRHLRRRRVADRRRRRDVAPGQRRARRALRARRARRPDQVALCVHCLQRAPTRPERMFMQFHGGVYRSDDAGETWTDIAAGLPSDFGFPLVVDPADADSAYLIPLVADIDRVTPDGPRARVRDARRRRELDAARRRPPATRTRTSPSCARRSPGSARRRRWSCTSARRPERSTGPATRERAGSTWRRTSRPSSRSPPPTDGARASALQRDLDGHARAAARRRVDLEAPVERVDAVAQSRAGRFRVRRVGTADAVVAHLDPEAVATRRRGRTKAALACAYLATLVSASAVQK